MSPCYKWYLQYPSYKWDLQEYLEEVENFEEYVWALTYIFTKMFDFFWYEWNNSAKFQEFYNANIKFFKYADIDNIEYFEYCLFLEREPNEIFCYIDIRDFFLLNNSLLEKIFSWEISIWFYDNFEKIAIILNTYSIPWKVEEILERIH